MFFFSNSIPIWCSSNASRYAGDLLDQSYGGLQKAQKLIEFKGDLLNALQVAWAQQRFSGMRELGKLPIFASLANTYHLSL